MAEGPKKKAPEGLPQSVGSEETYETSDPRPHYVELDALRGIAILMVVVSHIALYWSLATQLPLEMPLLRVDLLELFQMGYLGVPLFFLLSGYLLTWTEDGRKRRGRYSVLNYAKRRALRVVPAYYAIIAFVVLVLPIDNPPFSSVALHLTFLQGFAPSYPQGLDIAWWSLTPEVLFYAVLPLLTLKFRKFSQRAAIFALLVLVSLVARLLQTYDVFSLLPVLEPFFNKSRVYIFPTTLLYLFLAGMLLRMMVERRSEANREPGQWRLFVASIFTVVPVALLLVFPYLLMSKKQLLRGPESMIVETMMILIFASALLGSPILKPVLKFKLLAFFGKISYSLFLLHSMVMAVLITYALPAVVPGLSDRGDLPIGLTFVIYAFVSLVTSGALAYLSYRYIESPFMRIKPK